jgi:hypothetical protein
LIFTQRALREILLRFISRKGHKAFKVKKATQENRRLKNYKPNSGLES